MKSNNSRLPFLGAIIAIVGLYQFSTSFFLAKKSMPHISQCDDESAIKLLQEVLGLSVNDVERLKEDGILSEHETDSISGRVKGDGCWMPRRAEAIAIIVVDALRFDFALQHLPKSVGSRLNYEKGLRDESSTKAGMRGQSQLFKFVADPPTVTMQRLKGLTTGGLPTFADISGSFGGANVDEDSWVQQLYDVEPDRRAATVSNRNGAPMHASMAFVGDDTWVDLFPKQFNDSHPYPSFNTRDLDTVDDGCLLHLPRLLKAFGPKNELQERSYFEVVVSHFLGVDHVGHTYGPHNVHMDAKLNQMDQVLETIFEKIDEARDGCQLAFVFGDHGMTEDGNHGGGTDEEINAALFAHYSPGCGDLGPSLAITGTEAGSHSELAFSTINQIDLVPTISLLLGLPIPYANLGGVVPGLLPPLHHRSLKQNTAEAPFAASALALNAAQVWNYLSTYSTTANKLPDDALGSLKGILDEATTTYKMALSSPDSHDAIAYREACGLFKYFLSQATDLGKVVWTRFDIKGMAYGMILLLLALVLGIPIQHVSLSHNRDGNTKGKADAFRIWPSFCTYTNLERTTVAVFIIFQCALVTFSNSYILAEEAIIVFALSIICVISTTYNFFQVTTRLKTRHFVLRDELLPLVVAMCSRANNLLVSGHGLDPSIRAHLAHSAGVFLPSLMVLSVFRLLSFTSKPHLIPYNMTHATTDVMVMICLAQSWWEKRSVDTERHGYIGSLLALVLCFFGCIAMLFQLFRRQKISIELDKATDDFHKTALILSKVALFIITVTGPSAASSCILFVIQTWALRKLTIVTGDNKYQAPFLAALWRLAVRHAFYATGHACSFNRLHFSAAFVATEIFHFAPAGLQLFLNTFGWEIVGLILVSTISRLYHRNDVWSWFTFFQLIETVGSCISVSLMRRHLMVWAIFAPRFVFASIFLFLTMIQSVYRELIPLTKS